MKNIKLKKEELFTILISRPISTKFILIFSINQEHQLVCLRELMRLISN